MGDKADYLNRLANLEPKFIKAIDEVGYDGVLEVLESIVMDKHAKAVGVDKDKEVYWAMATQTIVNVRGILDGVVAEQKETK